MPKEFEDCVKRGGKVRTVTGPSEKHGLKKGEYVRYCTINGKTYRGEKKKKEASMKPIEHIKSTNWAILPSFLEVMVADAIELQDAQVNQESSLDFKQEGKTGVIKVSGPMTKEPSFLSFLFGGTSYSEIQTTIGEMLTDSSISQIILDIDSPGGTVNGAHGLVDFIQRAKTQKPIYAWSDGHMTSAAYWIGSATSGIFTSPNATVGSIGVVATHTDVSEIYKKMGVKKTYITGGKFKALGNPTEPLSDEGFNYIKNIVDDHYLTFYQSIAKNRGLSEENKDEWAEGRIFSASQGQQLGLIDKITSFDQIGGNMEITKEYLKTNHADLVSEIAAEATENMKTQVAEMNGQVEKLKADLQASNEKLAEFQPTEPQLPKEAQTIIDQQQAEINQLKQVNFEKELNGIVPQEQASKVMELYGKVDNETLKTFANEFARLNQVINDLGAAQGTEETDHNADEDAAIKKIAQEQGITLTEATVEYYKQ